MSQDGLVGYSGTVGKSLLKTRHFSKLYNSKNIESIHGEHFNTLVVAGISANKFLANKNPEKDLDNIERLLDNLLLCTWDNLVLISTIDVYHEDAYGQNREYAEEALLCEAENVHIIRLPALYGSEIKKNAVFDMYNLIPNILTEEMFNEIKTDILDIDLFYRKEGNLYYFDNKYNLDLNELRLKLYCTNRTALKFTNINSTFQWFNLDYLNYYIDYVTINDIRIYDITSKPISIKEIVNKIDILKDDMFNSDESKIQTYNERNEYDEYVENEIWADKKQIIKEISDFVNLKLEPFRNYIRSRLSVSIIGANDIQTQNKVIKYAKHLGITNIETTPTKCPTVNANFCAMQSIFSNFNKPFFTSDVFGLETSIMFYNLHSIIKKYKINKIVFGCPKLRNLKENTPKTVIIEFFEKLSYHLGCKILLEPNSKEYGTNFLCTTKETIKFIQDNNLENLCGVNLDLGTVILNNEDITKIINKDNIDLIKHVHISAPYLHSIINEDKNKYLEAIKYLNILDYKGLYSLESLNTNFKEEIDYFISLFL